MGKKIDLTGKRYGKLVVIKEDGKDKYNKIMWLCKCDCGNIARVLGNNLRLGKTKSCGCLQRETVSKAMSGKRQHNVYDMSGDFGICYTHDLSSSFMFDKEDYPKIKSFYWYKTNDGYFTTRSHGAYYRIHRYLLDAPPDMVVDHINHDTTDNRKSNLRICTPQRNTWNRKVRHDNQLGVTGVYKNKQGKYVAQIQCAHYHRYKEFETLGEAIAQRDKWEENCFKEYRNGFIPN